MAVQTSWLESREGKGRGKDGTLLAVCPWLLGLAMVCVHPEVLVCSGPCAPGSCKPQLAVKMKKINPALARQGMEWLKGKKLLCFEEVTLMHWKKDSLAQEPSLALSYAISCSC